MFDLFLNAARFAVSDDVRKSASSLIDLIRRSPEWQRDICSLEARIGRSYAEQTAIFSGLAASKMENLEYPEEAREAFKTAYSELIRNAFEHGCRTDKEAIHLVIDITQQYIAFTVRNPRGRKFEVKNMLEKSRTLLASNPSHRRGRGLLLVSELADTLSGTDKKDGVKAIFYRNRVSFRVVTDGDLTIIGLTRGLHNPSLQRRLYTLASHHLQNDLILDFRGWIAGTLTHFVILELDELYSKSGKQIIAILESIKTSGRESEVVLPDAIVASSLEEALRKLSRLALLDRIERKLRQAKQNTKR